MKNLCLFAAVLLASSPVLATKDCEELKSEIETKLQAKGVAAYTLQIVSSKATTRSEEAVEGSSEASDSTKRTGKAIGSCDGGAKSIFYSRG